MSRMFKFVSGRGRRTCPQADRRAHGRWRAKIQHCFVVQRFQGRIASVQFSSPVHVPVGLIHRRINFPQRPRPALTSAQPVRWSSADLDYVRGSPTWPAKTSSWPKHRRLFAGCPARAPAQPREDSAALPAIPASPVAAAASRPRACLVRQGPDPFSTLCMGAWQLLAGGVLLQRGKAVALPRRQEEGRGRWQRRRR